MPPFPPVPELRRSLDRASHERIPLEATTDSDVRKLYWFVNNRFVSAVKRDEIAFWRRIPGEYDILAVDDLGSSHSQTVVVQAVRQEWRSGQDQRWRSLTVNCR